MSTTSVGVTTAASALDPLVKQLAGRIDRNKDGQISTEEFGSFLTQLIQSGISSATSPSTLDDPADPAAPIDIPPSQWNDNNAPYGVTFAGFSPQNHTDLTLADLGVPGKAEKYAVYGYLLSNRVQPTADWAPAAAEALNRKYNTTVFAAIDGETLGYGSEFVHSAPNGYGMASGTYNSNATGEFFWGSSEV